MRIIEASPGERFQVSLKFDDGASGSVDLSDLAGRGVFAAWMEPGVFEQLSVSAIGALQWPGELDLCPDSLYLRMVKENPDELFPGVESVPSHA